ncbi:MAG: hypothetical protein EA343_12455 [Nodularia sp. (in: Bacteria)]|nr:MAG: hypothetical protein EA343_12455 [Nodularia sp. (in: cyanobacteria)]
MIAILALINLGLVFFDLSYLYARDFYLQAIPSLTQLYDPVKGVKPHPSTENYLQQVENLEAQVITSGLRSPEVENQLERLSRLSWQIIEDNPFAVADKSSTLEKIQEEMRQRTGFNSARDAFAQFWNLDYLENAGWQQEIGFWNSDIRPLIKANYYRDINRFGKFIDYFWLIDLPFVLIFALNFLSRTYQTSRRNPQLNWLEAMLRRWYDIFLLLPFARWLRVIPVTVRLYQSQLLNLDPFKAQINRDFAVGFAQEITEMVGIQVIDQMQNSIQKGDVSRWLFQPESRRPYVQINNQSELQVITARLVKVSIYDVIPKIQPDIAALIHHTIQSTLNESPVIRQLQMFPGLNQLPNQLIQQLTENLTNSVYKTLVKALEDPVGAEITARLTKNFRDALEIELQKRHNLQELEQLLVDMLEEIKINYVKNIAEGGIEKTVEEVENLQRKFNIY